MINKTIAFVCLLLAGAFSAPAYAADLPWIGSEKDAMAQAQAIGKPIWLYLHADYCVWCRVMQQSTFGDSRVRLLATAYILCSLNGEKEGKSDIGKYHVEKYPYQAILDASGRLLKAVPDYMDADKYAHALASDLPGDSLASLETLGKAHLADTHPLALLVTLYAERGQTEEATRVYAELSHVSLAPNELAAASHALGLADTRTGDDRAAILLLQKAASNADDPRELVALHFLLASACKRLGQTAEAIVELETVRHFGAATKDEKKEAQKQEENLKSSGE